MTRRSEVIFLVAFGICYPLFAIAQQSKQVLAAPIPSQIRTAQRVFIANAGGEEMFGDEQPLSGGADRAYNQLYAALKSWGRYELVASPADADLMISVQCKIVPILHVFKGDSLFPSEFDPQLRLEIHDPKTNALLWGLTEHAQWAILKGNRDKNFDLALSKVIGEVQRLSAVPVEEQKK